MIEFNPSPMFRNRNAYRVNEFYYTVRNQLAEKYLLADKPQDTPILRCDNCNKLQLHAMKSLVEKSVVIDHKTAAVTAKIWGCQVCGKERTFGCI